MKIKRRFDFSTIYDLIRALEDNHITPKQAVIVACTSIQIINLYDREFTKNEVLGILDRLKKGEKMVFFGMSEPFQITDIYKQTTF